MFGNGRKLPCHDRSRLSPLSPSARAHARAHILLSLGALMNVPLTERLAGYGHKVVVTGLVFLSAWGLAFVGTGCADIYMRAKERKRVKEAAAAEKSG